MKADLYKMPKGRRTIEPKRRADFTAPEVTTVEVMTVDKATECHVTPPDVAARMVQYLGPQGDFLTLEPSAGTGALVRALYEAGHSRYEMTMVERHNTLAAKLRPLGPVFNQCFLEYAEQAKGKIEFPRIIMNPPFRAVKQHVKAALGLLGRGGHDVATLVALVPSSFQMDGFTTLENLPATTFKSAKVYTKIVRFEK